MRKIITSIFVCMLLISAGKIFAQSVNAGDIRGTVTDPTGAVVPGATVMVLNVDTGVSKEFETNGAGLYDTNSIVPGNYTITFTHTGFAQLVRGPITVDVGFITVNAKLKVGSESQQITVTSDVPLLTTDSGEHSVTLEARSMDELPQVSTGAGDTWENFIILMPGATGTSNGGSNNSGNPGQIAAINGNLPYSNVLSDGSSTTLSHSQNATTMTFDDVAELQVSASSFSAQYGVGGVVFNQISKSGTDHYHGTLYDYNRTNGIGIANQYLFNAPQGTVGNSYHFNDYGASLGGAVPFVKHAFFYFNVDMIHYKSPGGSTTNTVPTAALLAGDFTGFTVNSDGTGGQLHIYDPTTQTIAMDANNNPYPVRQEYQNNQITTFDSLSAKFNTLWPTASSHIPGFFTAGHAGNHGQPSSNFVSLATNSNPQKKWFGRFDYDITPKNRITMSDTQIDVPALSPSGVSQCPAGCQSQDVDNNQAQITDVWQISSHFTNEARLGYTFQGNFFGDLSIGSTQSKDFGWSYGKADTLPYVEFLNGNSNFAWIGPATNAVYKEHVFDPSDVVTVIEGKHILHFGGEVLVYDDNSTAWGNTNAGSFGFGGNVGAWGQAYNYTSNWVLDGAGVASIDTNTGWDWADFLIGYANGWNAAVTPEYAGRMKTPQFFVQDDWKVRPNLTINLGVRYQYTHGWGEKHGNEDGFDPTVANTDASMGAMWYGSTHANGRDSILADTKTTILPRIGFSWLPNPKTTIRGGFGQYAYNFSLDQYGTGMGAPFGASGSDQDTTNGITPLVQFGGNGNLITPVTGGVSSTPLPYTSASTDPGRFNGSGSTVNGNIYHTPVPGIFQWNLSVQREISHGVVGEVSYVASHGRNLSFPTDLNAIATSELSANDTSLRRYTNYGHVIWDTRNSVSNYNSLQLQFSKRMSHGLSFNANYVYSKLLDDVDSSGWGSREGNQGFQNPFDPKANYGTSNFDVKHAFKGYGVYQLPFGKGKTYLSHGAVMNEIAGGWEVSGSFVLQSGEPLTVTSDQNTYNNASGVTPRPNFSGAHLYANNKSARCETQVKGGTCVTSWINPGAFLKPADGTYGNVGRNSIYAPGLNVFNLSAHKEFLLYDGHGQDIKFQFRTDATNVFNHASFSFANIALGGASGAGTPYTSISTNPGVVGAGRILQFTGRISF